MSVAALMLVKDEEDVIRATLDNLSYHVDHVYVLDNMSTDSTPEILNEYQAEAGEDFLTIDSDLEVGYWQAKKTIRLARRAMADGHGWVLPCDADECWYVSGETSRPIARFLEGLAPDAHIVWAELYNHLPTGSDPVDEPNPFKRIGWRQKERGPLGKVACRAHPSLRIEPGNHMARYQGTALRVPGLTVRHFSWRSPEQYVRKIRNGYAAYAETDLPDSVGAHWRMWKDATDEAIVDHFYTWFQSKEPELDDSLIWDPAPCH